MAAISQTINNVLGGVSQQPDPVKIPGQVNEALNAYLDPTFGCRKRPGTERVGVLGTNVPTTAKWFSIFRNADERYIAGIWNQGLNVWNADTAAAATVTLEGSASEYISVSDPNNLKILTVNDYTFLVNSERTVTMDTAVVPETNNQALIVINAISYNTAYTVNFLKDGPLVQVKIPKATRLSVSPASWEVAEEAEEDQGSCAFADVQTFVENAGAATNLGFTLVTNCDPTLVTDKRPGVLFPATMQEAGVPPQAGQGPNTVAVAEFGFASQYAEGSYLYKTKQFDIDQNTYVTIRTEFRVKDGQYVISAVQIQDYDSPDDYQWEEGTYFDDTLIYDGPVEEDGPDLPGGSTAGIRYELTTVKRGDDIIEYSYKSAYKTEVTLNNGGADWAVGDTVTVNMNGKDYTVTVEEAGFVYGYEAENTITYVTPADTSSGALSVSDITSNLTTDINALAAYSAETVGNVVVVTRTDGRDFNLYTVGGTSDSAMLGIKGVVNDVSRLPAKCKAGVTLKINNTEASDADDYYVKFETEGDIPGEGSWVETVKPGIPTDLNPATMPHVLERDAAGAFTVRPLTKRFSEKNFWAPRAVGDEKTNPEPTFVGKTITTALFYRNRLGFLSGENIIMSQAGDYFNFFSESALTVSDGDPIDLSVSSTKPSVLKTGIDTKAGLLLMAENSQFLLRSQDVSFGPSTAKVDEVGNYAYRTQVPPVKTGVSILFPTESATFSKVFEISIESLETNLLAAENTRIIPEYIPTGISWMSSVPNNSLVLMGTGNKDVYAFKFYNTGPERAMAGWSKWRFSSSIKFAAFDHDTGFFVQRHSNGQVDLLQMELLDDAEGSPIRAEGFSFSAHMDSILSSDDVVLSAFGSTFTRVDFPADYNPEQEDVYVLATANGSETFYQKLDIQLDFGQQYALIPATAANTELLFGIGFTFKVDLPKIYIKDGENNQADRNNIPVVEFINLDVYLSGRYEVEINKVGYQTRTVDLDMIRTDLYEANDAAVENFATRPIPVFCVGDQLSVSIVAPDPLPAALTSYSWDGHYSNRGITRQ